MEPTLRENATRGKLLSAEKFLTPGEVASILHVEVKTLANWRAKKIGPPVMRFQGVILYPERRLREWSEKQTEEMNGTQVTARQVALSLRGRRARVVGKHRLGGYRTQSEGSRASAARSAASDRAGEIPSAPRSGNSVQ